MASFIIGSSFLFVKISLKYASVADSLAYRFGTAFVIALALKIFGILKFKFSWHDFLQILPIGVFYPCLFFSLQAYGLNYSGTLEAGILQALVPIFVLFLSTIFLKEKTDLVQKLFILISVSGVFVIFASDFIHLENLHFSYLGVTLLFLSVISISCYSVVLKFKATKFEISKLIFYVSFMGFVAFFLPSLIKYTINGNLLAFIAPALNTEFSVSILFLGIFSSLLTIFLFSYALRYIEAFKVGIFSNFSTLVAIVLGVFFLNEELRMSYVLGSVLILFGVIGLSAKGKG